MEKYINKYWVMWHNSPFGKNTDKQTQNWIEDWERDGKNRRVNRANEIGTSNNTLNEFISIFVDRIYLQPIYYYKAVKQYPESLPHEDMISKRYDFLKQKSELAKDKYLVKTMGIYQELRKSLKLQDEVAINNLRNIMLYTDGLIDSMLMHSYYLYDTPIMASFVETMFQLKEMLDFVSPNKGLPKMNKYLKNVDTSIYHVQNRTITKEKTFIDYLKHDKNEQLAQMLKEKFTGSKGKTIALMIYTIRDYLIDEPIEKKKFYKAMADYFGKSVGSDASINKVLNNGIDIVNIGFMKKEHKKMQNRINEILESLINKSL